MRKLTILVDIDGVVADLHPVWLDRYNARFNDNLKLSDIRSWDIEKYVKPEAKTAIYDILREHDLYETMPFVPGAVEGIKALVQAGHRVVFVTSCVSGAMDCPGPADLKARWLKREGILHDDGRDLSRALIVANDKSLIKGDVMIDDGPHNLATFDGLRILFDAHHNRDAREYYRAMSWSRVVEIVRAHASRDVVRENCQRSLDSDSEILKMFERVNDKQVRAFSTGATRSPDNGRPDFEGYISPIVIERFGDYMTKHRVQSDGTVRESDNWQKGMPLETYIKGLWRHFLHLWLRHRGWSVQDPKACTDIEEDLCAILFNVQGYLHETLKAKYTDQGAA